MKCNECKYWKVINEMKEYADDNQSGQCYQIHGVIEIECNDYGCVEAVFTEGLFFCAEFKQK